LAGNAAFASGYTLSALSQYPTNPFYQSAGYTQIHYGVWSSGGFTGMQTLSSIDLNGCSAAFNFCSLYTNTGGTLYVPFGMVGDHYTECATLCASYEWNWYVLGPSGISAACAGITSGSCDDVRGFDLTGSVTGANTPGIVLTSPNPAGDPTCSNYAGRSADWTNQPQSSCWASDYATIQAAQQNNPLCPTSPSAGYTCQFYVETSERLNETQAQQYLSTCLCSPAGTSYNSTQIAQMLAQGPVTRKIDQSWYLYRMVTSIQLQIMPPSVTVQCQVVHGKDCLAACYLFICTNTNADLQWAVQNRFIPELDALGLLSNTRIAFGISVGQWVPQAINSWFGITGVWIGGQGIQTAGCSGSYCGTGNFVQQSHSQLPLYTDPGLSQAALTPAADIINIAAATNTTVQAVQQSDTYGTVYTYIDTKNLGVQYAYGGDANCTVGNLPGCIVDPNSIIINVPIVFDIFGSYTNYFYEYPGVPPNGGSSSGTVKGHVIDAASRNLLGQYSPIAGACVGTNGPCSGDSGQAQSPTDQNGNYALNNLPPATYVLYASASGYNTQLIPGVTVTVGQVTDVNFALTPVNPPGQFCLIPPISNPVPYQPPLYGGLCTPRWVIASVMALVGLGLVAVIVASPLGKAGGILAQRFVRTRRRQSGSMVLLREQNEDFQADHINRPLKVAAAFRSCSLCSMWSRCLNVVS
jgi:carboxypeptidase family protein